MIGVVVWSSAAKMKAVIWCEDQGALAYLHGPDNVIDATTWPEAGDMVELESEVRSDLRHAFNVRIMTERKFAELPGILRASQSENLAAKGPEKPVRRAVLQVVSSQDNPQRRPNSNTDSVRPVALAQSR